MNRACAAPFACRYGEIARAVLTLLLMMTLFKARKRRSRLLLVMPLPALSVRVPPWARSQLTPNPAAPVKLIDPVAVSVKSRAEVIGELKPISPEEGAGGVIPPSKNYFDLIQPILKKHNIPLVADEVICGFGRTGNLWGCETYNIKPDIIISSKCLTAGYFPMGAVIVSKEFADEFTSISEDAEEFPHGFTAGGHPVGCAIALKAIDVIINEGLLENVKNVSPYFHERLQEFNKYEHIGETRGIGLMAALEMVKNKDTKEPFEGHLNMGDKVANMSIDNGLICRPLGPAIVLCPQFIINKKQIDEMFDSLHSTLKQAFN